MPLSLVGTTPDNCELRLVVHQQLPHALGVAVIGAISSDCWARRRPLDNPSPPRQGGSLLAPSSPVPAFSPSLNPAGDAPVASCQALVSLCIHLFAMPDRLSACCSASNASCRASCAPCRVSTASYQASLANGRAFNASREPRRLRPERLRIQSSLAGFAIRFGLHRPSLAGFAMRFELRQPSLAGCALRFGLRQPSLAGCAMRVELRQPSLAGSAPSASP
jgi:hypothetical protein